MSDVDTKTPQTRLDARSDFETWANAVVAELKTRGARMGESAAERAAKSRPSLRRWASHMLTKLAD